MKRIIPFALLLIMASCQKEEKKVVDHEKSDWAKYELKGNVESLSEKSYELVNGTMERGKPMREVKYSHDFDLFFNDEGKLVLEKKWLKGDTPYEETTFDGKDKTLSIVQYMSGKPFMSTEYVWDKANNNTSIIKKNSGTETQLTRNEMTYENGNMVEELKYNGQDILMDKTVYLYDENGNVKEEHSYLKTETVQFKNINEYNENGKITSIVRYNKDNGIEYTTTYAYDGDNLIAKETTDGDGKVSSVNKYTFDKGNLIKEYMYDGYDKSENTTEHHYDANNHKIGTIMRQDGKITYKAGYAYDDKGNISLITIADDKETVIESKSYKYEYDAKGNWTSKIISINDKPSIIVERTFKYFE
ncbi:RHS repeat domain-containing protein [Flavobacterium alkalisoli]|uniref:RHS repeat domain-containing protein n=1 Tax=Flavobacterium alkalisoli TaxID=2602769 RepID=UPI003A932C23